MIALIAAYTRNRVIGRDGKIPWEIPGEQHRFRDLTTGNVVIMGRRTYEEIGRPLPNRETILISSTLQVEGEHITTVSSLSEALALAGDRDVFIAGGSQLYREALPIADVLYLTTIETELEGDCYFPELEESLYTIEQEQVVDGVIPYTYWTYRRKALSFDQVQAQLAEITASSGIVLGLDPIRQLLKRLGNPQDKTKFFHIAGTNGKGSTGAMLRTVLQKAGYRVGHYASPFVFDPLEVWRVNDTILTKEDYCRRMTRILSHRAAMVQAELPAPTAFELETALAFLTFAEEHCDFAVLECGMGGEDDATNVITTTVVSLLTAIGLDHTRFLGNTLEEIAAKKGGIIRHGVPVVTQQQREEVAETLARICREKGSPLYAVGPWELEVNPTGQGSLLHYDGKAWELSLSGYYQGGNASQVIETVKVLRSLGISVSEDALKEGLSHTHWPGRFETVCEAPRVILDGAHNPNASKQLRKTMDAIIEGGWQGRLFLIMGVLADKDFTEVVSDLAPLAAQIYTVTPHNPRRLPAEELADCVRAFCPNVTAATIPEAMTLSLEQAAEEDIILVCGSLSYLGEVRQWIKEKRGEGT